MLLLIVPDFTVASQCDDDGLAMLLWSHKWVLRVQYLLLPLAGTPSLCRFLAGGQKRTAMAADSPSEGQGAWLALSQLDFRPDLGYS